MIPSPRPPNPTLGYKWRGIISHIYKKAISGNGIGTVFLPCDLDGLLDRLDLCAAARRSGNNSVRNEFVVILDALKRQEHLTDTGYQQAHCQFL